MPTIQEVFTRIEAHKKTIAELRAFFKEKYLEDVEYTDLDAQVKKLNTEKRFIRERINTRYHEEATKLKDLSVDLASDRDLLSDLILTAYTKGESVEIKNSSQQMILPIFTVTFKTDL